MYCKNFNKKLNVSHVTTLAFFIYHSLGFILLQSLFGLFYAPLKNKKDTWNPK